MVAPIDDAQRAERIWIKILRKPSQIAFTRLAPITDDDLPAEPTITLPAQTARVNRDNRPRDLRGDTGEGTQLHCVVYGVRDHPDPLVSDTDIERGDTFVLDGDHYIVDYVNLVPGGKQSNCILQGIGT